MSTTSQLAVDGNPPRPGFWSVGKGEFEQTWQAFEAEILNQHGFPQDVMKAIRCNSGFRSRLAQLCTQGMLLTREEERAASTGIDMITIGQMFLAFKFDTLGEARKHLGGKPLGWELKRIGFSTAKLTACKDSHILLPGPAISRSLSKLEDFVPSGVKIFPDTDSGEDYVQSQVRPRWYLLEKKPCPCLGVPERMAKFIPDGTEIPQACELIYASILHNIARKVPLWTNHIVATRSRRKNLLVGITDADRPHFGWKRCTLEMDDLESVSTVTSVESDLAK